MGEKMTESIQSRINRLRESPASDGEPDASTKRARESTKPVSIPETRSKKCKYPPCGAFFTPKRKDQVYCHDDCRKAHYSDIYFHVVEVFKVCPNCGKDFATTKPLIQIFCLPGCRTDARSKAVLHQPLEYLEQAIKSMEEYFDSYPTSDESKAKALAKYYSHFPEHFVVEIPQQINGGCVLCGSNNRQLGQYKNLELCSVCLSFVTYVDQGMVEKYKELLSASN